ncbi:EscU/YscU/HrcU family type III secretion system export apparatus switch protein [Holophaga foetida]|uniref:EscU/YscU/HrcU family type III secretion system export apparatus switch protein n=1 Tax=Holophaga foetida TaxID=35839 RepID=UPI0002472652|nr:EscU/YscU/HrcU family type III secretion system export apparatus switch protein [Holophaga foetida]
MARPRRLSAVALRYQPEAPFLDSAPRLVAKGQGLLADRILELAKEHHIPVEQDADLLALLEPLDVNRMIPKELFQAVAILLATLYKANKPEGQVGPGVLRLK